MDTSSDDPLADLSAVHARLDEMASRLAAMARGIDARGREDIAAEVIEVERLVETAARRARRLLRQHRPH